MTKKHSYPHVAQLRMPPKRPKEPLTLDDFNKALQAATQVLEEARKKDIHILWPACTICYGFMPMGYPNLYAGNNAEELVGEAQAGVSLNVLHDLPEFLSTRPERFKNYMDSGAIPNTKAALAQNILDVLAQSGESIMSDGRGWWMKKDDNPQESLRRSRKVECNAARAALKSLGQRYALMMPAERSTGCACGH